jgi:hypothetical protein
MPCWTEPREIDTDTETETTRKTFYGLMINSLETLSWIYHRTVRNSRWHMQDREEVNLVTSPRTNRLHQHLHRLSPATFSIPFPLPLQLLHPRLLNLIHSWTVFHFTIPLKLLPRPYLSLWIPRTTTQKTCLYPRSFTMEALSTWRLSENNCQHIQRDFGHCVQGSAARERP